VPQKCNHLPRGRIYIANFASTRASLVSSRQLPEFRNPRFTVRSSSQRVKLTFGSGRTFEHTISKMWR
jgi:hypothetical protein